MVKRPWKPALLALLMALGVAGCGNGDEPADAEPQEPPAASDVEAPPPADEPLPGEEPAFESEAPEEEAAEVAPADAEPADVEADAETTLGESPAETLDEGAALPGETTADDIDAIIEETERRFEEASRRIDEQFEVAEEEAVVPEPMEGDTDAFDEGLEFESSIQEEGTAGPSRSEVDEIIAEQERRFEEAQRRLEEQFDEVEQETPPLEPMEFDESELELEPMEFDEP
ncbi:hypothetical protein BDK63_002065 [Halomonas campaniensis]|uniref:Lipoprotein n=1 Tax=Halomonas campaniensis TaxID=213554 RepID=A0A7W5K3B5_9GAMM|nr:hypothetical protein [Halomonas campaniensis]MBB3331183.1 hypothetical protein [Halomonas campaniensis]